MSSRGQAPVACDTVAITGPQWSMDVWPTLGGALVAARARHAGAWLDVTPPVDAGRLAERNILKLGGFVPGDGSQALCLEPVSHVTDVHNRRHLAL